MRIIATMFPPLPDQVPLLPLVAWMGALTVKHVLADFIFQTNWIAIGKDRATGWALPLFVHTLGHGVLSAILIAIAAPHLLWLAVVDFVIHGCVDRAKGIIVSRNGLTGTSPVFWWLIGIDQALHHLTDFGLAIVLAIR